MKNLAEYNSILRYESIANLANISENKKIIDCSCGYGIEGNKIIERYKPIIYYGVDIDKNKINKAKQLNNRSNCIYNVGDIRNIDIELVDYFFCIETLEHIAEEYNEDVRKSISESLVVGGTLLISVPGNIQYAMDDPRHLQFITKDKLITMFYNFKLINENIYVKHLPTPDRYSCLYIFVREN